MRRIAAFALFACLALGCESDTVGTDMIVMPATASAEVAQEAAVLCQLWTRCWTFGTVSEGHVVRHTFEFVNEGPGQALLAGRFDHLWMHRRPNLATQIHSHRANEAKLTSRSTPTKNQASKTRSFPSWATRTQASFGCTW